MNTQLQAFQNNELTANIRCAQINDAIWFVASDLAKSLEYDQTANMLKFCDESSVLDELNKINTLAPATKWINESDLYACIFGSTKPEAKRFRKWVTSEVLPSIRKTGSYSVKQKIAPSFVDLVEAQNQICNIFNLPESGKIVLFGKFNAIHGNVLALPAYGVDAGTNPTITSGSSRATFSATTLLKQFAIPCSAVKFNQLAESKGFIETKTRPSSGTKTKEYKSIVGEGLKYGKNITSPSNPRETQPHWFEDSFEEFAAKVI